jgi:3-oxoadipate enol-lactonase
MPFIKCNKINTYYEISGKGPPLLLINGLGGDTRSWEFLKPYLEPHFKLIIFDLRCAGRSDKPKEPFTAEDMAEDTAALIQNLGFEKIHALGFSMGGAVAISLIHKYPKLVDHLILVSTIPAWTRPFPPSDYIWDLFRNTDITREHLQEVFDVIYGPKYKESNNAEEYINFRINDQEEQPTYAYLDQLEACRLFDGTDYVKDITAKTTIITGDSDKVIPTENAKWFHETIKGSKLFVLKGVGHIVPIEAPEELAECITESVVHRDR